MTASRASKYVTAENADPQKVLMKKELQLMLLYVITLGQRETDITNYMKTISE